jgi:hypothetical protein
VIWSFYAGLWLVGLSTLLLEIALVRVFSFTIWYHFAYVVISTALLGFGASGTLVAVRPAIGSRDLRATLARWSIAAAVSVAVLLGLIVWLPLHPMSVLERPDQAAIFVLYQVGATLPFFFSGLVVSLVMRAAATRVDRLYFWDLLGAGIGAATAVWLMNALGPPGAMVVAGVGYAAAGAVFAFARVRLPALSLAVVMLGLAFVASQLPFTPANTKQLAIDLNFFKSESVFNRWTALFRTDLVKRREKRPATRRAWGLSHRIPEGVPFQPRYIVHHDGSAGSGIYDLVESPDLDFLRYNLLHLPYAITPVGARVLVIGVGGGRDVVNGIRNGASRVTGVELDPVTLGLIRDGLDPILGGFFRRPEVTLVAGEGRHFVRRTEDRFDLIQLTGVDTFTAEFSGAYVLAESYLYTVEAFRDYLDRLRSGGMLSVTVGDGRPEKSPRSAARMVSVAHQALLERGVERPADHIVVVDSRELYVGILIRLEPFREPQVRKLADFAREMDFRPLLLPGDTVHPLYRRLASLIGPERQAFLDGLEFEVSATTDDRPFFHSYTRWSSLLGLGRFRPWGASALGQLVLLILLFSLTVLGALFVLGPLFVFQRRGTTGTGGQHAGILVYFLALGLGFMLFEISLMQRFVLFLGYPTYSLTVTLACLLVFLGCGSFLSRRWVGREQIVLPLGVIAIGLLALFYMEVLPGLQERTLGASFPARIAITLVVLAPLGLVLGGFFPLGIRRVAAIHQDIVPWAWGINGCASVTGTVLAVVLAMTYGFTRVWLLSLLIYAVGVIALLLATRPVRTMDAPARR